jgi:hypothetical protein
MARKVRNIRASLSASMKADCHVPVRCSSCAFFTRFDLVHFILKRTCIYTICNALHIDEIWFIILHYIYIFELTLIVGSAGLLGPRFHHSVSLKAIEWGPASEIYSSGFLEHICFFLGSKWVPESGSFLNNGCQFFNLLLRVKAPLYRDFSV